MRIGAYDLQQMKNKILTDLYGTEQKKIDERKTEIAKRNRNLWLNQYQYLLNQLPESMITTHTDYHLSIKYSSPDNTDLLIDENWVFKSPDPIINPVNQGTYGTSPHKNSLHEELKPTTDILCKDILKLQKERSEMSEYLTKSFQDHKGSIGLRELWDESLHKYLPTEPIKTSKKDKKIKINPISPTFLKTRMTTNLLEDN
jgi:hypothetical protein